MLLQLNIKNGKIANGADALDKAIKNSFDGIYTLRLNYVTKPKTIKECSKYYFHICEVVAEEGTSGYKTKDIHQILKDNVLKSLPNFGSGLIDNYMDYVKYEEGGMKVLYSTKMLNLEGWYNYIEQVKKYLKENMDFIL